MNELVCALGAERERTTKLRVALMRAESALLDTKQYRRVEYGVVIARINAILKETGGEHE
jgi:hypothetical protein